MDGRGINCQVIRKVSYFQWKIRVNQTLKYDQTKNGCRESAKRRLMTIEREFFAFESPTPFCFTPEHRLCKCFLLMSSSIFDVKSAKGKQGISLECDWLELSRHIDAKYTESRV